MRHGTTCRLLVLLGALIAMPPIGFVGAGAPAVDATSLRAGAPVAAEASTRTATPAADRVADYPGGIAARLRDGGLGALPGDLYLLMAVPGSDAAATVYVDTPFRHSRGEHDDTHGSNVAAKELAEDITGERLELLDLTSAPGGGESGGVVYALGYLDLVFDGRFTAGLRVAATGKVRADGYVEPISHVDAKAAAAALAGSAIAFVASIPDESTIATHAARFVGEMQWTPSPETTLADERGWDRYHEWGAERPAGMDVVAVRHIGDVAAYLCGAGAPAACEVLAELAGRPDAATNATPSVART